ncbi:MAG TPA: DUF1579 family protein [Thermoanaerobaculia bacterium]|nr:DUF1579 family protein [Thermoanaerobaculia bacterium]
MNLRISSRTTIFGILSLALLVLPALGQEAPQPGNVEMSPEEKAMMEKWEKAMTPGPQHADLAAMAGTWTVESKWWMTPGAEPQSSTGTAERTMILGGRVMVEKFNGDMMGMPFEGMGATGFDNVSGQWWGTWMDSMGTGMMATTGTCADHKCEFVGSYNDAVVGGSKTMRMTSEHQPDREMHVMYDKSPDGKEIKVGELVYTRKQ